MPVNIPTRVNDSELVIAMAQLNPLVGDIPGNTQLVIEYAKRALSEFNADMVVYSELVLTAYPPEDLLLRPSLTLRIEQAMQEILAANIPLLMVIGYPGQEQGKLYNMLALVQGKQILATYKKQILPNYQVFDEKRYFAKGQEPCLVNIKGTTLAFTICEDMWEAGPMLQAKQAGARLMVNINGSPFHIDKRNERLQVMQQRILDGEMPMVYVNQVGGQDELVFDGASMVLDEQGNLQICAPVCETALIPVYLNTANGNPVILNNQPGPNLTKEAEVYKTLVLGMRDYVQKNGFPGVVLGLSGGIDSAVTLAIATDALGSENVHAVMMPFKYTAGISIEDAEKQAKKLGVHYREISIEHLYEGFMASLEQEFAGHQADLTEQNLQARCRGVLLMAISNKKGLLVLTTGNKSEMAVGYSTLYGDMAGGFDVLKDVPKMLVYALARYRNEQYGETPDEIIPSRVIDRPPSAELAPDQVDEDNLPPYEILDQILEYYIEQDMSANAIIEQGFARETVERVIRLVDLNEYKRRQAPIGVRISKKGFGRDRRYPVTSGWKPGN